MAKVHHIHTRLIPILESLSSSDYQISVWGKKHPKYCDSYSEAEEELREVYQFFAEADEWEECPISKKNLSSLKDLRDKILEFKISDEEYTTPELLVQNPKWIEFQNQARQLLKFVEEDLP